MRFILILVFPFVLNTFPSTQSIPINGQLSKSSNVFYTKTRFRRGIFSHKKNAEPDSTDNGKDKDGMEIGVNDLPRDADISNVKMMVEILKNIYHKKSLRRGIVQTYRDHPSRLKNISLITVVCKQNWAKRPFIFGLPCRGIDGLMNKLISKIYKSNQARLNADDGLQEKILNAAINGHTKNQQKKNNKKGS